MQTITVPAKTFENILLRLDQLGKAVEAINEKLEDAPTYGSDEWWEWSNRKAQEDIKKGRYTTIRNKKELKEFFNSLKTA